MQKETVNQSITIIGGKDKDGHQENTELTITRGEIICVVGPTGSGKSRLLGDIECLAQKDTPSGRTILIDGHHPTYRQRFSIENKPVAQLSQNMNFIMDLSAEEFIIMHAESRELSGASALVRDIIECANELTGEKFSAKTQVTQLSGGQSRALMIADTALLSPSPIVLIDEIENAGVDCKKALQLLVKEDKIIFVSTHDPILALLGYKRINIQNGAIRSVIETSAKERQNLFFMEHIDRKMLSLRNMIRTGIPLEFDVEEFFREEKEEMDLAI